jgi:predicted methyltransferase
MKQAIAALALTFAAACAGAETTPHEQAELSAIEAAVNGAWRSEADRARDRYRHPAEALAFWGVAPNTTIVDIAPGGGWWTEILAPYAAQTGGRYVAATGDLGAPNASDAARTGRQNFLTRFGDQAIYGDVSVVDFSMRAGLAVPDASADFILVARAFHNWSQSDGVTDRYMAEFARALKPGGILAVEQHRAPQGANVAVTAENGYVPEAYVIEAAQRAGLALDARAEINANPADTRDHPFGVWTLPPVRQSAPRGQPDNASFDHAPYDAIGESDRMTLRFRKPG